MTIRNYNDYQLIDLFNYISNNDLKKFEEKYKELINYENNISYLISLYKKYNQDLCTYGIIEWTRQVLFFINDISNKDFRLTDEMIAILGKPCVGKNYLYKLMTIVYPSDAINIGANMYTLYFPEIIWDLVIKRNSDTSNIKNKDYLKLIELSHNLRMNYYQKFLDYHDLISIIVAHCYLYDNSYELVFNFLDNPVFYITKLVLDGYTDFNREKKDFLYHYEGKNRIFMNASTIFKKQHVLIK